ncbi:SlyX family protein [Roseicyclus sp. F158]|uniref:SlyX family protein n=1 Tax=Tropicimonas omnivorans TaxID=3075590 RepID=A0ABU3DDU4_9RHOB|nr:SlyX family protein [Roseicyclus sp. F158]MDT0681891.1 SlyX family protein [Roseicyclus sp. F158]
MNETRIEEELAHLRRVTDDLSEVVARQETQISRLEARVAYLTRRAADDEAAQSGGAVFTDETPPHY